MATQAVSGLVESLVGAPLRSIAKVADYTGARKSTSVERIQQKVLEQAAELGADALIFHRPQET